VSRDAGTSQLCSSQRLSWFERRRQTLWWFLWGWGLVVRVMQGRLVVMAGRWHCMLVVPVWHYAVLHIEAKNQPVLLLGVRAFTRLDTQV
jgi:hypothetical protein